MHILTSPWESRIIPNLEKLIEFGAGHLPRPTGFHVACSGRSGNKIGGPERPRTRLLTSTCEGTVNLGRFRHLSRLAKAIAIRMQQADSRSPACVVLCLRRVPRENSSDPITVPDASQVRSYCDILRRLLMSIFPVPLHDHRILERERTIGT